MPVNWGRGKVRVGGGEQPNTITFQKLKTNLMAAHSEKNNIRTDKKNKQKTIVTLTSTWEDKGLLDSRDMCSESY